MLGKNPKQMTDDELVNTLKTYESYRGYLYAYQMEKGRDVIREMKTRGIYND